MRWEFDTNLQDSIGNLHGTVKGSARISGGALLVDIWCVFRKVTMGGSKSEAKVPKFGAPSNYNISS